MNKKVFKVLSFTLQGIYVAFCILDIILCFVYRYNFDTSFGSKCAYFVLELTCILAIVPAMPLGILLNVLAMPEKQLENEGRIRWIIWTICSPILYILFCLGAMITMVVTTGGV